MPLRLQVVSAHRESMGASYIREFAACGGTIGRSLECDWPLPDSKRYISSKHAMIDYQGGAYYLVDLSRNGVYMNGSDAAVGNGNPQRLFDGDTIRLGEFEIKVALIEDPEEGAEDGMRDSIVRAQLVQEDNLSDHTPLISADSLADGVSLDAILTPGDGSGELSALTELPPEASALLHEAGLNHGMEAAAKEFLEAAGLDPKEYEGLDPKLLLRNAAVLLAEFTEGAHALLSSKDAITKRLNIQRKSKQADGTNPLRGADGVDSALRLLLSPPNNDVHVAGNKAVESAFDELMQHQRAVMAAMRNAIGDYVGYFDPTSLDKAFGGKANGNFRELYAKAFEGLSKINDKRLPQRFDEEFVRAYESETSD